MNLKNFKITNRGLYWGLILAFGILYLCVGFVSTLHSITFFQLANNMGLAVLLGLTYEVGQAAVLFSILMTKNKEQFLPWVLMILLTALQITANVFASFKWMVESGSNDWVYWQKAILIGVTAANPEMYQIIISWIAGALLPIVALGMTALVANQLKHIEETQEPELKTEDLIPTPITPGLRMPLTGVTSASTGNPYTGTTVTQKQDVPFTYTASDNPDDGYDSDDEVETLMDAISKKAKEPLAEEIKVPYVPKYKRFVDPLKKKSHIQRIKDIKEINPPSKGDEALEYLKNEEKRKVKESINSQPKDELVSPETSPEPTADPSIPVEVTDVKAVPKQQITDFWGSVREI